MVDHDGRVLEVAAEADRVGAGADHAVVVTSIAVVVGLPVADAERALALEGVVMVGDRVQQRPGRHLLGGPVGVDRDVHVVRAKRQPQVQSGDARTDHTDPRHAAPPLPACIAPASASARKRCTASMYGARS